MKQNDPYTYRVFWSEEDVAYVGACAEFPSLSWLESTPEKALTGIRKTIRECIADMKAAGESIPEAIASKAFSGRFVVRVPPELHRTLATRAAESGISLNRLISHKLAS